jgi:hypothetical protein
LCIEALPIRAGSAAHQACTPHRNDASCNAFDWPPLRHENCRIAADDEAKVEDGCGKGVSVANSQAEISAEAEQRLLFVS